MGFLAQKGAKGAKGKREGGQDEQDGQDERGIFLHRRAQRAGLEGGWFFLLREMPDLEEALCGLRGLL